MVLLGASLLLILIPPFFRGLFFPLEQLVALMAALALFAARWLTRPRGDGVALGPLDLAVAGLAAAYALSSLFAAAPRAAVQDVVKYLLYALLFWLVQDLARTRRERLWVMHALVAAALGVAVLGLGAAAGTFQYRAAWEGSRISSSLQYPNTLAAYLTAGYFATLGLWSWSARQRPALGFLYLPVAAFLFIVFVHTLSRGAWLLLPVVAAIFWAASPRGARLGAALAVVASVLAAVPGILRFPQAVKAGAPGPVWLAGLAGPALALVLQAGLRALLRLRPRAQAALLVGLAVGAVVAAFRVVPDLRAPDALVQRLQSIRVEDYSARSRIEWTYDAVRIALARPVLGWGGGGWNAVYLGFQRWPYWSTQVHNHFAQTLVEVGVVGFGVFVAMWLAWLYGWWRAARAVAAATHAGGEAAAAGDPERAALAGVLAAGLALGAHSALDFNLSLSAVSLYLWALFGLVRAAERERAGDPQGLVLTVVRAGRRGPRGHTRGGAARWVPAGAAVVLLALAGSLALGIRTGRAAARALQDRRVAEAAEAFRRAVRLDPLEVTYRMDLGSALESLAAREKNESKRRQLLQQAERQLRQGVDLEPYSANYRTLLGLYLLRNGQVEEGLQHLERARELHPHEIQRYETLAQAYAQAGQALLVKEPERAREYLRRAAALPEEAARVRDGEPAWVPTYYRMKPPTARLNLAVGQARALLGQLAEAEALLAEAAKEKDLQPEALAWLAAVQGEAGRKAEAQKTEAAGRAAGGAFKGYYDRARLYLTVALHPEVRPEEPATTTGS